MHTLSNTEQCQLGKPGRILTIIEKNEGTAVTVHDVPVGVQSRLAVAQSERCARSEEYQREQRKHSRCPRHGAGTLRCNEVVVGFY